jgi:aminopeptidase N
MKSEQARARMRTTQGQTIRLKNYRVSEFKIHTVDLDISLHPTQTIVKSTMTVVRQKNVSATTPLVLDGDELKLNSVSINGKPLPKADYKVSEDSLTLTNLPKTSKFEVQIETEINPTENTKLMGLYRSGGNYCTQCEAEGFRRITYFLDRPDILAIFTTRIEADKSESPILLGNGNPVKKGTSGKGRHFAVWHDPHPKPAYLFAVVGGDLGSIHKPFKTMSGRKVKLGIYVEKGKEDNAQYAMDALIRSMKWDEEVFGCEYDLDVFNIVAVSDFNMGAMENKGLNIFNDKYVLGDFDTATDTDFANIEGIIAHEYFHNWTGNRITCRDWFQLCLKEGLTVYRDQEFSSDARSRAVKRIQDVRGLKSAQFPEDAGPLAHNVRPETYKEINNFYTATIYQKGAELIRMLEVIIGEKNFKKGMAIYFKRHDGDAATIEQFLACFEKAAKIDLSNFALWYSQAGTPLLSVSTSYNKKQQIFTMEVEQHTPSTPGQMHKKPVHIPQRFGLIGPDGEDLQPTKTTGAEAIGDVLHITKRKHKIEFHGITERPVLSLNRGFTAPVNIDYRQSPADMAFLAANDRDTFSRWQAYQNYASKILIAATKAIKSGNTIQIDAKFLEISRDILTDEKLEPAFRATVLSLPSEGDLAQLIGKNINPEAIHTALMTLTKALGKTFEPERKKLMQSLQGATVFNSSAEEAGKRSLSNLIMRYAVISKSGSALKDISRIYEKSNNMTDRINALMTLVHHHPDQKVREKALERFFTRYKDNHIVLDKWFSVQASRPAKRTLTDVRKLMKHEMFTFNNPNRFRSLLGVFAMGNQSVFNADNGKGYELVADALIKLDKINPQVTARMLTAFKSYRALEPGRRKLCLSALKKIEASGNLSRDTSDILGRMLAK